MDVVLIEISSHGSHLFSYEQHSPSIYPTTTTLEHSRCSQDAQAPESDESFTSDNTESPKFAFFPTPMFIWVFLIWVLMDQNAVSLSKTTFSS